MIIYSLISHCDGDFTDYRYNRPTCIFLYAFKYILVCIINKNLSKFCSYANMDFLVLTFDCVIVTSGKEK